MIYYNRTTISETYREIRRGGFWAEVHNRYAIRFYLLLELSAQSSETAPRPRRIVQEGLDLGTSKEVYRVRLRVQRERSSVTSNEKLQICL